MHIFPLVNINERPRRRGAFIFLFVFLFDAFFRLDSAEWYRIKAERSVALDALRMNADIASRATISVGGDRARSGANKASESIGLPFDSLTFLQVEKARVMWIDHGGWCSDHAIWRMNIE